MLLLLRLAFLLRLVSDTAPMHWWQYLWIIPILIPFAVARFGFGWLIDRVGIRPFERTVWAFVGVALIFGAYFDTSIISRISLGAVGLFAIGAQTAAPDWTIEGAFDRFTARLANKWPRLAWVFEERPGFINGQPWPLRIARSFAFIAIVGGPCIALVALVCVALGAPPVGPLIITGISFIVTSVGLVVGANTQDATVSDYPLAVAEDDSQFDERLRPTRYPLAVAEEDSQFDEQLRPTRYPST